MRAGLASLLLAVAVASLAAAGGQARPEAGDGWTIARVAGLGGRSSQAFAVNDAGQVAGIAETVAGDQHAFVWTQGPGATDLGTLGGTASTAFGINIGGGVVGLAYIRSALQPHAYLWRSGKMTDLGTLGGPTSSAVAVNASGQVAGNSPPAAGSANHAFLWRPGSPLRDLGTLGGSLSVAGGIDASGAVAGTSYVAGDTAFHAYVWTAAHGMRDLGAAPGLPDTLGATINSRGVVAGTGFATRGNVSRGLVWSGGSVREVGVVGGDVRSELYALSDVGDAVGISYSASGTRHAFLWTGGRIVSLTSLARGWTLTGAFGVDDLGEVAGTGVVGGQTSGFLLSPPPRTELAHLAALTRALGVHGVALALVTAANRAHGASSCGLLGRFAGAVRSVRPSAGSRLQLTAATARVVDRLCGSAPQPVS